MDYKKPFPKLELEKEKLPTCRHPEHYPPILIYFPSGEHTWTCPQCGNVHTFTVGFINC